MSKFRDIYEKALTDRPAKSLDELAARYKSIRQALLDDFQRIQENYNVLFPHHTHNPEKKTLGQFATTERDDHLSALDEVFYKLTRNLEIIKPPTPLREKPAPKTKVFAAYFEETINPKTIKQIQYSIKGFWPKTTGLVVMYIAVPLIAIALSPIYFDYSVLYYVLGLDLIGFALIAFINYMDDLVEKWSGYIFVKKVRMRLNRQDVARLRPHLNNRRARLEWNMAKFWNRHFREIRFTYSLPKLEVDSLISAYSSQYWSDYWRVILGRFSFWAFIILFLLLLLSYYVSLKFLVPAGLLGLLMLYIADEIESELNEPSAKGLIQQDIEEHLKWSEEKRQHELDVAIYETQCAEQEERLRFIMQEAQAAPPPTEQTARIDL